MSQVKQMSQELLPFEIKATKILGVPLHLKHMQTAESQVNLCIHGILPQPWQFVYTVGGQKYSSLSERLSLAAISCVNFAKQFFNKLKCIV